MRVPALRGANWRKRITGDGLQGGGRAYPERARGSQPADSCLRHAVGAGNVGLRNAVSELLDSLLPLMPRCLRPDQIRRPRQTERQTAARMSFSRVAQSQFRARAFIFRNSVAISRRFAIASAV